MPDWGDAGESVARFSSVFVDNSDKKSKKKRSKKKSKQAGDHEVDNSGAPVHQQATRPGPQSSVGEKGKNNGGKNMKKTTSFDTHEEFAKGKGAAAVAKEKKSHKNAGQSQSGNQDDANSETPQPQTRQSPANKRKDAKNKKNAPLKDSVVPVGQPDHIAQQVPTPKKKQSAPATPVAKPERESQQQSTPNSGQGKLSKKQERKAKLAVCVCE